MELWGGAVEAQALRGGTARVATAQVTSWAPAGCRMGTHITAAAFPIGSRRRRGPPRACSFGVVNFQLEQYFSHTQISQQYFFMNQ